MLYRHIQTLFSRYVLILFRDVEILWGWCANLNNRGMDQFTASSSRASIFSVTLALQASFAIEIGLEWLHKVYTKQLLAASWCVSAVLCNSKHAARSDLLNCHTLPHSIASTCVDHWYEIYEILMVSMPSPIWKRWTSFIYWRYIGDMQRS